MPSNNSKSRRAVRKAEAEARAENPDLEARAKREAEAEARRNERGLSYITRD